jgi:macrolide-specific efflux system membrane fusion protein
MPQMSAQVFFVLAGAYDVITVPVSAVRYTDRPARGNGRGKADASSELDLAPIPTTEQTARRTRPAEVTVVHEDGMQETRAVQVGATDRVNAEIVSGLSEGETVVVGTQSSGTNAKKGNGGGNKRGPVLFGG